MKVLSISLDKKILDENSKNFQRQKEYAQLINELHIVIFSKEAKQTNSGNLYIYRTGGRNKINRFLRAYKVAKKIFKNKDLKDWLITTQDPFFCGFLGHLLKRKFGVRLHIQLHGDFFSSKYFIMPITYSGE